jgi:hypothetical protein
MEFEKDGIKFTTNGYVVKCNLRQEGCTRRMYCGDPRSPQIPEDVDIIKPEGESNIIGRCPILSQNGEVYVCSHQIYGITVKSRK